MDFVEKLLQRSGIGDATGIHEGDQCSRKERTLHCRDLDPKDGHCVGNNGSSHIGLDRKPPMRARAISGVTSDWEDMSQHDCVARGLLMPMTTVGTQ